MSRSKKISVGVDCTNVDRWRAMLGELVIGSAARLFTKKEHEHCRNYADPAPHYAAVWSAKEAVFKALSPHAPPDLRKIEIRYATDGKPYPVLPKEDRDPQVEISVSMSHTPTVAMAAAIAVRKKA